MSVLGQVLFLRQAIAPSLRFGNVSVARISIFDIVTCSLNLWHTSHILKSIAVRQIRRNPAKKRRPYLPLAVTTSSCPTLRRVEGDSCSNENGRWAGKILLTTNLVPFLLRNNEGKARRPSGDCQTHCRFARSRETMGATSRR